MISMVILLSFAADSGANAGFCFYYQDSATGHINRVSPDAKVRETVIRCKPGRQEFAPTYSEKARAALNMTNFPSKGYSVLDASPSFAGKITRLMGKEGQQTFVDASFGTWKVALVEKKVELEPGHFHYVTQGYRFTSGSLNRAYNRANASIGLLALDKTAAYLYDGKELTRFELDTGKKIVLAKATKAVAWTRDLNETSRIKPVLKTSGYKWEMKGPDDFLPKPEYSIKRRKPSER